MLHHKKAKHQPDDSGASDGGAASHPRHTRREAGEAHSSKAGLALLAVLLTAQLMVILDITAVNSRCRALPGI